MKTHHVLVAIALSLTFTTLSGSLSSHKLAAQNCWNCNLDTDQCTNRAFVGRTYCAEIPNIGCSLGGDPCFNVGKSVTAIIYDGSVRSLNGAAIRVLQGTRHRGAAGVRFASLTEAGAGERPQFKRSCTGIVLERNYSPIAVAQLRSESRKLVL